MSLFNRLLKLHNGSIPLEDFFTELVAHLFSTNKEILCAWLKYLDLPGINFDLPAYVRTQQTFPELPHHSSDSRPDIIIELVNDPNRDIIFIESKIGSSEGCNQLQRYAEILDEFPDFRHKFLVYITRDFVRVNIIIYLGIQVLLVPEFLKILILLRQHQAINF